MEQPNQGLSSSLTNKRKRGRPRRDESQTQQQMNPPPLTSTDENMIGQVVSGVVEGSFEAGYFLNVKVADTDKQLRGVVFFPEKVTPVTPATDLFPQARMYAREHIPVPSLNQRTLPQTDNLNADKNLSATLPNNHPMSHAGVGTEAINERNLPIDTHMQDVGGSSAVEKLTEPEGQTLSLMPQFASDATPKEVHTVLRSEACAASKSAVTITTALPTDSIAKGSTTLVDFFPAPEASRKLAVGSSSTLRFELFQNETKRSGTEEVKSPADVEPRGVEEKLASPVDDVPEELQLELGNKKLSASAIAPEANPDHSASSKSGFLTNLFEGREETAKEPEGPNAASKSGFPETTTEVDDNES
ncbi:Protein METABOLIC NETWORK MODULATOR 1 [Cardamine amara subsp. amara]|uniref:Protein METABOLIC NETWORK MODULATOR 1 n=1 Tax=Cardamine amara subsp. amara TaxID=228776 RepID=A0ABD1AIV6_CARAN